MTSFLLPAKHKSHAFLSIFIINTKFDCSLCTNIVRECLQTLCKRSGNVIHPQLRCIGSGHETTIEPFHMTSKITLNNNLFEVNSFIFNAVRHLGAQVRYEQFTVF